MSEWILAGQRPFNSAPPFGAQATAELALARVDHEQLNPRQPEFAGEHHTPSLTTTTEHAAELVAGGRVTKSGPQITSAADLSA